MTCRPPRPGVTIEFGSVATSEISLSILLLLQPAGNSLFPGMPVPGACPPPVASPSRICWLPCGSVKSTLPCPLDELCPDEPCADPSDGCCNGGNWLKL